MRGRFHLALRIRALIEKGAHEEVDERLADALHHYSGDGRLVALGAVVHAIRGQEEGARELIARAEGLAPGEAPVAFFRAQVAFYLGDQDAADHMDRARAAAKADPYALLDRDLNRLEASLT